MIPYGIDVALRPLPPMSRARIRGTMGAGDDTLVVLAIADEFDRKGVARLIEALGRSSTRAELWVIGGDDPRGVPPRPASAGVADRVHFLGRKPYTELPRMVCGLRRGGSGKPPGQLGAPRHRGDGSRSSRADERVHRFV